MKILVMGSKTYGNIPLTDLRWADRTHPDFELKYKEMMEIKGILEQFAIDHSSCYIPDDNWLPRDIEIYTLKEEGVCSVAVEWAIVNWCEFTEFKNLSNVPSDIDYSIFIVSSTNYVISGDKDGSIS